MANAPLTLTTSTGSTYSVISSRLVMLYIGAWTADCVLDAVSISKTGMPSGKVVLTFGGVQMTGTVASESSGQFGPVGYIRVVGGGAGWDKPVKAQAWHADNGVQSTGVYSSVASQVGEQIIDLSPTTFQGFDFEVTAGPASRVFRDTPWWVGTDGITRIGPRPPSTQDPSLLIGDWLPFAQRVTFACQTLLLPNTTLNDPRFGGSGVGPTVMDVEQMFDADGSKGWGFTASAPCSPMLTNMKAFALEATRAAYLRSYRYRLTQTDGPGPGTSMPNRLELQAVNPTDGVPDVVPLAPWGVQGINVTLDPSSEHIVAFENAAPELPRVIANSLTVLPKKISMDAQMELDIGPTVPAVNIAGGSDFVVLASPYESMLSALSTFITTLSTITPPISLPTVLTAIGEIITAAGTFKSALSGLPSPATTKTKAT